MAKDKYIGYTREQLIDELKKLSKRKKYGLVWEEEKTKERFDTEAEGKLPVLVEDKKSEIETDEDKPTNILIEGDNYHALSVLNYTHAKSIDIIYIDPPYNTGAKDWKYNNDFVEKEDAYRHSKWISFMSNRLKLAKKLLSRKGVLICTIDENEHSTLGLLLQEIFPDKEIVCITIIHNPGGIQGNNFSYTNEFAYFVYPQKGTFITKRKRDDIEPVPLRDWGKESSKREAGKNCFYPILVKDGMVVDFGEVCADDFHPEKSNISAKQGIIEIYPIDNKGVERKWRFARQSIESIKDELVCKKIKEELVIVRDKKDYRWKTVWTDVKYNANVYGTKLLNEIIQTKFPFPKSLYAVMDCIKAVLHNKDKATILDFFAGSGTTGHAVLELNKEDGGRRQFILCTNNENNICKEVTYPRVKNVIDGYKFKGIQKDLLLEKNLTSTIFEKCDQISKEIQEVVEINKSKYKDLEKKIEENIFRLYGINEKSNYKIGLGGNLKYFHTDFVGAEPSHRNKKLLTQKSVEMLCLKESTFKEVLKKKDISIYKNKEKYTAILFDELKIEDLKKEIRKLKLPLSVYVFSLEGDDFKEEFEDLNNDITLCSIPEAILKVYRRIYETAKPKNRK